MARCERCGGANTLEVCFTGQNRAVVIPIVQRKKMFPKYCKLKGIMCADCGAVFSLRAENPEKLRPFVGIGM